MFKRSAFCVALIAFSILAMRGAARAQMGLGGYMNGTPQGDMMNSLMSPAGPAAPTQGGSSGVSPDQIIKDATKGIKDADPRVRATSLDNLRDINDPKVDTILMEGLIDPDLRVRIRAVDILGARHEADAVPLMTQHLFLADTTPVEKLHLVAALGRIGDSEGTVPIMDYLEQADDDRGRGTAVFALGEIGDPRANDILIQSVTKDKSPMVRRLAQEALEKIGGELPTARSQEIAKKRAAQVQTTDQKLAKMREINQELLKLGD